MQIINMAYEPERGNKAELIQVYRERHRVWQELNLD